MVNFGTCPIIVAMRPVMATFTTWSMSGPAEHLRVPTLVQSTMMQKIQCQNNSMSQKHISEFGSIKPVFWAEEGGGAIGGCSTMGRMLYVLGSRRQRTITPGTSLER